MRKSAAMLVLLATVAALLTCQGRLRPGFVHCGSLSVSSTPTGATVWLDSVARSETTDCLIESVPAGTHTVRLHKPGYFEESLNVDVAEGRTRAVNMTLSPAAYGVVGVNSTPTGAQVWLDSLLTGDTTNCVLDSTSPGRHSIRLVKAGYADWYGSVDVVAGGTVQVVAELASTVGALHVTSTPAGATVWLDSASTGRLTDCTLENLAAGYHDLTLTKDGYQDWIRRVLVVVGETAQVSAALSLVTCGWIDVSSTPAGAAVWLDSANTGRTTNCVLAGVAAGPHQLALRLAGYQDWDSSVVVSAGDTASVSASLAASTLGWLRVNSAPTGASIWLDDSNTGRTTNCLLSGVNAGTRGLTLELAGYVTWDTSVLVVAADTVTVTKTLEAMPETGMVYIGVNPQGYDEYLWLRDSMVLVRIPAGFFTMGSNTNPDEGPIHDVYLDEYYCDKYEVSNRQYKRFCDATSHVYPDDPEFPGMPSYFFNYPSYPVVLVDWVDASAYAAWAGRDLPTEAQWEKAARGTDSRTWPWGEDYPGTTKCNWNSGDPYRYTSPVGAFPEGASYYGAMDMAGNVWEWGKDWYGSSYYAVSPDSNPAGPASGTDRIARGGSYNNNTTVWLRCAERYWGPPSGGNHPALGYRCAYTPPQLHRSRGHARQGGE